MRDQPNRRMPAEWESHAATWLTWPHCPDTWPGQLEAVVPAYVHMIRALAESETVYVNTLNTDHREAVRTILATHGIAIGDGAAVQLLLLPTDDEWIRDYGALIVRTAAGLMATDWEFNAWGRKYERIEINDQAPRRMAAILGIPRERFPMVLEGGAIDVNGAGACLTTESCLLNPNRNPGLSRQQVEMRLAGGLGVDEVIWLGEGIEGDDTDGHVDDLARFVGPETVVAAVEADPSDANFDALQENLSRLRSHRLRGKDPLHVVRLPMPPPFFHEGRRLPASYMNFYVANTVVLLPVFGDSRDGVAAERLQECFPDRRIVPIDARHLVWGLGACHCLTQQVPRAANAHQT